jgi:hypothetical protein
MREVARAIWEWRLGVGSSSRTKQGLTLMGRGSRILEAGVGGEGQWEGEGLQNMAVSPEVHRLPKRIQVAADRRLCVELHAHD